MTYSEIRKNEEVLTFIKKGNANLGAMGFTDHSEAKHPILKKIKNKLSIFISLHYTKIIITALNLGFFL